MNEYIGNQSLICLDSGQNINLIAKNLALHAAVLEVALTSCMYNQNSSSNCKNYTQDQTA